MCNFQANGSRLIPPPTLKWDQNIIFEFLCLIKDRRIDNSRRGAIHVLCDISRTKKAITSCNRSNERASFSACVGANGILLKFDLRNRLF